MKSHSPRSRRNAGQYGAGRTLRQAVQQLLAQQQAVIQQTSPAASSGKVEALHDLRAAFRRLRCLLRVFCEVLPGTKKLGRSLGRLNQDLGSVRDLDVWIAFLNRPGQKAKFARLLRWQEFVQIQIESRERQLPKVRRTLRSHRFNLVFKALKSLPDRVSKAFTVHSEQHWVEFAAKQLEGFLGRLHAKDGWRHDDRPRILHKARKRYRRARYLAEFLAPALGAEMQALANQLHEVEQRLGRAHDMDRAAALLKEDQEPLKRLAQKICRRRRKSLKRAKANAERIPWKTAIKSVQTLRKTLHPEVVGGH